MTHDTAPAVAAPAVCGFMTFKRLSQFIELIEKMAREEKLCPSVALDVVERTYRIAKTHYKRTGKEIEIVRLYETLYVQCYALRNRADAYLKNDTTASTLAWAETQTKISGCIVAAKLLAVAFSGEISVQDWIRARKSARAKIRGQQIIKPILGRPSVWHNPNCRPKA